MSRKRPVHVEVTPKKGESIERLIKRFSRKVKKEGVLEKYRESLYYVKKSDRKRKKRLLSKRKARQAAYEKREKLKS